MKNTSTKAETVMIVGASDNADRYSYKAFKLLSAHQHKTILVHPTLEKIDQQNVYKDISAFSGAVDTLTVYVNPSISLSLTDKIIALRPKRVIFNPGSENKILADKLEQVGIKTENACTLVLLQTGQF
jgi:predicted CoA-binding protein